MTDIIASDYQPINPSTLNSLEPAIDPANRPTFLLDWEVTLKCNLDCSYCVSGPDGAHWNGAPNPPLAECIETIDFMFKYVDLYMQYKPKWTRAVVLNIYGGESLFHPQIEQILQAVHEKYQPYAQSWPLKVSCTTNLIVKPSLLKKVEPLVQEWTVSYHCEATEKQKSQFLENTKYLKDNNNDVKMIILMHSDEKYWPELFEVIDWCNTNHVRYLPRQLDGKINSNYNENQIKWLKTLYQSRTGQKGKDTQNTMLESIDSTDKPMTNVGRACCGGRSMCVDSNHKNNVFFVTDNNFKGWHCSVNWFFLYVKQFSKEIFVNKDCRMNFNGKVEPLTTLENKNQLLEWTEQKLKEKNMPVMVCNKIKCMCGLCAPKSSTQEQFFDIMEKHVTDFVFDK